ncbi:hypothetical protein DFR70_108285 [Nocardia tenerifensis]|uniref:Abortive infection protein n=1 Tax=Nocardia tenerifensis TaxID=228006 RepID=A0A318K0D4_9NOCA|nr:hypothetical protein [Nocardia tenerifensis]PXX61727.1 hypothetical protein DFR70_108285 [Nocardia tenerifensis]
MTYDTGFIRNGRMSREDFDPEVVRRELAIIRDDLHCNAVQIVGGDADRLELAAACAAELGLEVWFSPYPLELTTAEMLSLFTECARRAERIRESGAEVVFVTGVELSVMSRDLLPGNDVWERLGYLLGNPDARDERLAELSARLDKFLAKAITVVRKHFGGKLTYCAIQFERIDWTRFDIMSIELIRSAEVADRFRAGVRELVAQGKPLAVTGFGAATWRGAADVAPRSNEIVEYDSVTGDPIRLDGNYFRDEAGQAAYLEELLEIFDSEGVDSTFVFLFALHSHPHRPDGDPRDDLDLASLGIVKVLDGRRGETYPDMTWEPKVAFSAVAEYYGH